MKKTKEERSAIARKAAATRRRNRLSKERKQRQIDDAQAAAIEAGATSTKKKPIPTKSITTSSSKSNERLPQSEPSTTHSGPSWPGAEPAAKLDHVVGASSSAPTHEAPPSEGWGEIDSIEPLTDDAPTDGGMRSASLAGVDAEVGDPVEILEAIVGALDSWGDPMPLTAGEKALVRLAAPGFRSLLGSATALQDRRAAVFILGGIVGARVLRKLSARRKTTRPAAAEKAFPEPTLVPEPDPIPQGVVN